MKKLLVLLLLLTVLLSGCIEEKRIASTLKHDSIKDIIDDPLTFNNTKVKLLGKILFLSLVDEQGYTLKLENLDLEHRVYFPDEMYEVEGIVKLITYCNCIEMYPKESQVEGELSIEIVYNDLGKMKIEECMNYQFKRKNTQYNCDKNFYFYEPYLFVEEMIKK